MSDYSSDSDAGTHCPWLTYYRDIGHLVFDCKTKRYWRFKTLEEASVCNPPLCDDDGLEFGEYEYDSFVASVGGVLRHPIPTSVVDDDVLAAFGLPFLVESIEDIFRACGVQYRFSLQLCPVDSVSTPSPFSVQVLINRAPLVMLHWTNACLPFLKVQMRGHGHGEVSAKRTLYCYTLLHYAIYTRHMYDFFMEATPKLRNDVIQDKNHMLLEDFFSDELGSRRLVRYDGKIHTNQFFIDEIKRSTPVGESYTVRRMCISEAGSVGEMCVVCVETTSGVVVVGAGDVPHTHLRHHYFPFYMASPSHHFVYDGIISRVRCLASDVFGVPLYSWGATVSTKYESIDVKKLYRFCFNRSLASIVTEERREANAGKGAATYFKNTRAIRVWDRHWGDVTKHWFHGDPSKAGDPDFIEHEVCRLNLYGDGVLIRVTEADCRAILLALDYHGLTINSLEMPAPRPKSDSAGSFCTNQKRSYSVMSSQNPVNGDKENKSENDKENP